MSHCSTCSCTVLPCPLMWCDVMWCDVIWWYVDFWSVLFAAALLWLMLFLSCSYTPLSNKTFVDPQSDRIVRLSLIKQNITLSFSPLFSVSAALYLSHFLSIFIFFFRLQKLPSWIVKDHRIFNFIFAASSLSPLGTVLMVESKVKLTKYDLALLSHTYDIRICAASELPQGKSSIQYPDKWTIGAYVYSYMHIHHHQNDKLFFYINALTNAWSALIYKFVT